MKETMLQLANEVMNNAYAPYSKFLVGACIRTTDNELFVGCNIENISYSMTLCAEASALGAMISAGKKAIAEVAIVSSGESPCPPCGACRQRIAEFSKQNTPIHMTAADGSVHTQLFSQLFPEPFNNHHLRGKA